MANSALAWMTYGAVFVTVLLLVYGLYYLIFDHRLGSRLKVNQRLGLAASYAGTDAPPVLRRTQKKRQGAAGLLLRIPAIAKLDTMLSGAGCRLSGPRALACVAAGAVAMFFLLQLLGVPSVAGAPMTILIAGAAPFVIVKYVSKKRLDKFLEQLPDAVDMMVRSLRAGHPIAATIELVARETSNPVRAEFKLTHDEMAYGLDLRDALDNLARRISLRELHYMAVAIRLQITTGGNLAETLEVLSRVIRERRRLKNKIKALSAEGRMSATILSALPFVIATAIRLINPTYYADVPADPVITGGLCGAALMIGLGIFIMRRMVNFRV